MKNKLTSIDDLRLRSVLREWKVESALPPRFQEAVWRRIERCDREPECFTTLFEHFGQWIGSLLPRPALAVSYFAVLLAVGVSVGWMHARADAVQLRNDLETRYVQSVDPYKKAQ